MTSADCRLDLYPHCEDECDSSWCALRGCSASSCHCVRKPASKAANDRPLGIADLIDAVSPGDVLKRYPGDLPRGMASLAHWPDWWYWCRRHVDAHKAGVRCKCTCITSGPDVDGPDIECPRHGIDSELPCVDVGPFMSEAEARRLAPVQIVLSPVRGHYKTRPALGMVQE